MTDEANDCRDHSLDRLSEQVAALDTTLGACLNAMTAGQNAGPSDDEGWADTGPADAEAPTASGPEISEQLAALRDQLDQLSPQTDGAELHAKLDALDQRLGTFETRLSDLAAPATPDLSEQREIMARFTTAMATIGRRQEEAVTRLETQLQGAHDRLEQQISTLEQTAAAPQEPEAEAVENMGQDIQPDMAAEPEHAPEPDTDPEIGQDDIETSPDEALAEPEMDAPSEEHSDSSPPVAAAEPAEPDPQIAEHLAALHAQLEQLTSQSGSETEMHAKLDALDQRLNSFEIRLSDIAVPPTLDLRDQREIMARFTTAMASIGRRQEQAMARLEEQLQSAHDRLDHQATALEQAAEEGRQTRQALDTYSTTFKDQIGAAIDGISGLNTPDAGSLALQVATALQSALAETGASGVQEASSVADDLMRGIRVAVAEVVADAARQTQADTGAAPQVCEK